MQQTRDDISIAAVIPLATDYNYAQTGQAIPARSNLFYDGPTGALHQFAAGSSIFANRPPI